MRTRQIIIIDTEARAAFFLVRTLECSDWDCRVSVANSAQEALNMLNSSSVDLLITDMRVPGISGLELIRRVRECSPLTRTILMATHGNDDAEAEARRLQAYRAITEPLETLGFTQAMQETLRHIAISRPGLAVISDESFEAITRQLEALRRNIGARCIFLANTLGRRLAQVGTTAQLDNAALLSLLSHRFATSNALAGLVGAEQTADLNFYADSHYEFYSTTVCDSLFLAIVYDLRVQTSRIGIVWLHTRRVVKRLLSTLSTGTTAGSIPLQEDDLAFGLTAELDALLTEEDDSDTVNKRQFSPAVTDAESSGNLLGEVVCEEIDPTEDESDQELFDLEAAIARELTTADEAIDNADAPGQNWPPWK